MFSLLVWQSSTDYFVYYILAIMCLCLFCLPLPLGALSVSVTCDFGILQTNLLDFLTESFSDKILSINEYLYKHLVAREQELII